jgi:hypothetical protein
MIDVFSEVRQLAHRIEGSLIFTLVRFLYSLFRNQFDNPTILFINLFMLAISFAFNRGILDALRLGSHTQKTLHRLLNLVQKFSTLVLTQALIKSVQPVDLDNSMLVTLLQCLVSSVCLVILLTLLPGGFHASENGQQFMRLVLYMFTDNTEFLVKRVSFGWTLPFLAMAGFVFLFHTSEWYRRSQILETLTKAFNLSLTNLMILSSWTVDIGSTEQMSQLTQLVGLLVLFDALQGVFPEFSAMRDYAVWQGAAQVYGLSKHEGVSGMSLVVVCLFVVFAVQASVRIKALVELAVLVVINVILGDITLVVSTIHTQDVVTIVVLWLTLIEVGLETLKSAG